MSTRDERLAKLEIEANGRILLLDGAMGTMLQSLDFDEADFRGERFVSHNKDLRGNNDLLSLTQPRSIKEIHKAYFEAGADLVETNTFNSNSISQSDYSLEAHVAELNEQSARLAREAADEVETHEPNRPCYVVGVLGPTNRTASISPSVNDPGFRNTTFDALTETYIEATLALVEGGSDIIMVETIFDTLNGKAALMAIEIAYEQQGFRLPIMISGTITDRSGRTLSGQTPEAFWYSVQHVEPFSVGLNCALGAADLRPYIEELSGIANTRVSAHPNAGLPNEFGEYDETPKVMGEFLEEFAQSGLVNIVGGCCGTTPDHIREFRRRLDGIAPRKIPIVSPKLRLSGLEPFVASA